MAAVPSFVKIKLAGASLTPSKVLARTEMERGVPRTRRTNSDALQTFSGVIVLHSKTEKEAFEDWYYSRTGGDAGAAWVDWDDGCPGVVRQVRIAELGALTSLRGDYELCEWQITLEWMRSNY